MDGIAFIRDLAVVMVVAAVAGWICRRIGLSVVVGYLAAGAIVGPYTPPFQLVTDVDRVQMLAQFGLVFLIFSIGLGLSLGRLQRLGLSVALATAIGAILMLNICRLFGSALGWSSSQSLFLAGMLMVSSSAIIAKVLEEMNAAHERAGQLALGITILEDVVAVAMLTVLTSLVQFGGQQSTSIWPMLGKLSAFVVFVVFVSLMIVPKMLHRLTRDGSDELRTIAMTGTLLGLAWLATEVGYSMALGAFLLGAIVAGTRYKTEMERAFDTMRHVFGAVFFVAIGMLFNFKVLAEAWPLVLGVTLLALIARPIACALGLLAVGSTNRESIKAGLTVTPIGEFSFVMAELGVSGGVVPESFYAVAVGTCLLTSIAAPVITRNSDTLTEWLVRLEPQFVREWFSFYHEWLDHIHSRQSRSLVWKLTSKRFLHVGLYLLFVSALLLFWRPLYRFLEAVLGRDFLFPGSLSVVFWMGFGILLMAPLIALWRNLEAIVMIFADAATRESARKRILRTLFEAALKTVVVIVLAIWLLSLLHLGGAPWQAVLLIAGAFVLAATFFSRRLLRWHNRVEYELRLELKSASSPAAAAGLSLPVLDRPEEWNFDISEITLPSPSDYAGKRIRDLALRKSAGCSIVGIDRHGLVITNPSADEVLYSQDRLLLMGTAEQLAKAEGALTSSTAAPGSNHAFSELTTETVDVPESSGKAHCSLQDLNLIRRFGVQVCGISRNGKRRVMPNGTDLILPGDQLLVLGTHDRIQECRLWFERQGQANGKD